MAISRRPGNAAWFGGFEVPIRLAASSRRSFKSKTRTTRHYRSERHAINPHCANAKAAPGHDSADRNRWRQRHALLRHHRAQSVGIVRDDAVDAELDQMPHLVALID